jgi:hypothetical protein
MALPKKRADGAIVFPKLVPLPSNDVLPGLKATGTATGHITVENEKTKEKEKESIQTVVYEQKAKNEVQKQLLESDIRYQMARWFRHDQRAEFIKSMYHDAYKTMYKKNLQVLVIDGSEKTQIVPDSNKVRRIRPSDFKKLEAIIGRPTIKKFVKLPNKLTYCWFPLVLLHPHTFDANDTQNDPWLATCTYTSYTLIPFPDGLSGNNWLQWPALDVQQFLVHFLLDCPPIEIQ